MLKTNLSLTTSINSAAYFLTPNITGKAVLYITVALSRTPCYDLILLVDGFM
jgi:hypothetical protein